MFLKLLTWVMLYCSSTLLTVSAATSILFVDQHNNPISDVVVSFGKAAKSQLGASPEIAVMDQVNYQFNPKVLVIDKDQWVDFPNSDEVRHHVYSFSSPKTFEIKMFSGSDAAPIQFEKSGIVVLGCNIHDSMVGYIYIGDNEHTVISSSNGMVHVNEDIPILTVDENKAITVWHWALSANSTERKTINLNDYKNAGTGSAQYVVSLNIQLPDSSPTNTVTGFRSKLRRN